MGELQEPGAVRPDRIPNKYKELIGLAVSGATRCRYCCYFHTEAARLFGASEDEITETALIAKNTMGWSTYLNTLQFDYDEFTQEFDQISAHVREQMARRRTRLTIRRPAGRDPGQPPAGGLARLRQPLARPVEVVQDAREQVDGGRRSVRRSAHRVEREPGARQPERTAPTPSP